jgi:anti-sigma regulatory factor (Ser/Thr protein kinase)
LRLRIRSDADATRSLIAASNFASDLGFSKHDCNSISTSVSELARNILKYAGSGEILIEETDRGGVQVTARDRGPGIADVAAAMQDHYSSSGTLGLGLPGVRRMMDEFEIETEPGKGTRVVVRKWKERQAVPIRSVLLGTDSRGRKRGNTEIDRGSGSQEETERSERSVDCDFFVRPCRGERVSGDAVVVERRDGYILAAIIDALGHGPNAYQIAKHATAHLQSAWEPDVGRTMRSLHEALRGTDGAAAGLCVLDIDGQQASYAGVGNTVVRTWGRREKRAFSTPGTLGHQIREPREHRLGFDTGDVLMLYTDGVKERFELDDYPQLRYESAKTIARTVVSRFGKHYDDASCVVLRYAL